MIFEKPSHKSVSCLLPLQATINVTWTSALWGIASDVYEITLLAAFRANSRGGSGCDQKSALSAFPVGHVTLGADVPYELTVCCVPTVGTYPFVLFLSHFLSLLYIVFPAILVFRLGSRMVVNCEAIS